MRYTIEVADSTGTSVNIAMRLPFDLAKAQSINNSESTWHAEVGSVIRPRNGRCLASWKWMKPVDIRLHAVGQDGKYSYGLEIYGMFDTLQLVNSSGTGYLYKGWELAMSAGYLNWTLLD